MAADEKDRFIQYLVDKVNMYELDRRATELAVEEFQATFDSVSASLESLKKEMEEIKAELREERSKRKKAEAKARKLDQQLKYAQKNKIGFVSPERRYEAPGCCTAAAKVIIIMGKDAGFSWFPNRSVAINCRENRLKPLYNIYKQRLTVSKHATNERIVLVVV